MTIRHTELKDVTPEMLAWWYGHVEGTMSYAGQIMPRYMVWHPLDHIFYKVVKRGPGGDIGPGTRIHLREAFQREPANVLDVTVEVVKIDAREAVIHNTVLGLEALRLVNRFNRSDRGALYTTELTIGTDRWPGRLGFNRIMRALVMPGGKIEAWALHHVQEIGNLENFLPDLYRANNPAAA
jgi:hypothetical protein